MAKGESVIYNPLKSEDTLATISIMQKLGINISIRRKKDNYIFTWIQIFC